MKLLYILNIAEKVNNFSYTSMLAAQALGIEYHIAGNWGYASEEERHADEVKYGIHIYQIDFIRTPYHPGNHKAYKQLLTLAQNEQFDIIHCNTPIGGILGRMVGKRCKTPCVIYQAHGFHFYKGAPLKNWLLYFPVEQWFAHYTDAIITINKEDYKRAQHFHLHRKGKVYYVPGVGIDITQYIINKSIRVSKRTELNLQKDDIMLISMGDLIDRKNYPVSISAVAKSNNPHLQYFVCGEGPEEENLRTLIKQLGVEKQVHLLGFRYDIKELLNAADIYLFSTKQEGLPRSMMEAMAMGKPCVVSDIRGNSDLIENGIGGFLCKPTDVNAFANAIYQLEANEELQKKQGLHNLQKIEEYSASKVTDRLRDVYLEAISLIKARKGKKDR